MSIIQTKVETFVLDLLGPAVPLAEQIRSGNYDYVHMAITCPGNFTLTLPPGKREVVFYSLCRRVSSEQVIDRMKHDGCVPALIDDALTLGVQFPDLQCEAPLAFLGTVLVARRRIHVPVLLGWNGKRKLDLIGFGGDWHVFCRFAAVRGA